MKRLSAGTLFFITLITVLATLFSVNSPTLSGSAPPTETPWYMVEFEYMTQEAR